MSDSTPVRAGEQRIAITRIFDAPRELVFRAWTDPDHVAKWYGPAGFDTPRDSVVIDPRVARRQCGLERRIRQAEDGARQRLSTVRVQDVGYRVSASARARVTRPCPGEAVVHAGRQ